MKMSLNISISLNLILGLQFTSMISQNKCVHLLIGFLSFFTGNSSLAPLAQMEVAMGLQVPPVILK